MKNTDSHFWVSDIVKRLPVELLPKNPSWSALLSAVTKLKTERNNALCESERLRKSIVKTIEDNLDLADGENCTLIELKRAVGYDDVNPLTDEEMAKREWRRPTEADKQRKCRARSPFEKRPFYVEWNAEYGCWAKAGAPHILISVSEILSAV